MCVHVYVCVYEVQFVVRGLMSFPYRLGHQQCKEGRWYWWIWGSGIIGALSSGSNYAGSAVWLATAQIILDQKLPHISMDVSSCGLLKNASNKKKCSPHGGANAYPALKYATWNT